MEQIVWVHAAHAASHAMIRLARVDIVQIISLIILVSLVPVHQHILGLVNLLESLLSQGCCFFASLIFIRVPLQSQLLVGFVNFWILRTLWNSKDFVVIFALGLLGFVLGVFQLGLHVES